MRKVLVGGALLILCALAQAGQMLPPSGGDSFTNPRTGDAYSSPGSAVAIDSADVAYALSRGWVPYPASSAVGGASVNALAGAMTYTPDCRASIQSFTAQTTGTLTLNNPGRCLPFDGQIMRVRLYSPAAGTVAYAFGSAYHGGSALPLPTQSTAASSMDMLIFEYEAANSRWDLTGYMPGL